MASTAQGSNYAWAMKYLTRPIASVVEVGSRDGLDAIALASALSCRVDAFEAAPQQFLDVQQNIRESGATEVYAHELALSDENGLVDFWTVDAQDYDNTGLGSFYEVNFDNRPSDDVDAGRDPIQRRTTVTAARFDSLEIPTPDLLVMDVQGAETRVLQGFGSRLRDCRYVICEAERVPSYQGGNSFRDLHRYLASQGFRLTASTIGSGSNLDRRINYWRTNLALAIRNRTLRPDRIYQGCFDVLYVNS